MGEEIKSISDDELIELIIGKTESVKRFLERTPDLYRALANLYGIPDRASGLTARCRERLAAAVELGRRMAKGKLPDLQHFSDPATTALYLATELQYLEKEMFLVLSLNCKNMVVGKDVVSVGSAVNTVVSQREILMSVMSHNGTSFIIAHNHPSGDPKPSMEDVRVTDNLRKAGKLMGIPLIDHIIIGNGEYYSFREEESKED